MDRAQRRVELVADRVRVLLDLRGRQSQVQERLLEELQRLVQKLRRTRANQDLTLTRYFQEEAQQNGDPRAPHYQKQVLQLAKLIHSIDQANRRLTSKR